MLHYLWISAPILHELFRSQLEVTFANVLRVLWPIGWAWWKRQPWNVDRRPSTTDVFQLLFWSTSTTDVFYWSTSTILTFFYWSTSTRLSFSTGRRRPLSFSTGRRRPQSCSGRRWTSTVDAVDVHFTDVFIMPFIWSLCYHMSNFKEKNSNQNTRKWNQLLGCCW